MGLTDLPLIILTAALAFALPVLLLVVWRRLPGRVSAVVLRLTILLVAELCTLSAVALAVNRHFAFYDTWDDLFGRKQPVAEVPLQTGRLVPADGSEGRVVAISVHGTVSGVTQTVLVWLPPQYDQPTYAKTRMPVLMVLPGQPGSPNGIFSTLDLGANATRAIASGAVRPFVAVLPPIAIAPPRDTECTDIPHGPQADSWLSTDVREDVVRHFRVTPDHWSTIGWSTGGFCSAKMLLRHPTLFKAAVTIGGYFGAEEDHSTGTLFGHNRELEHQNSPLWLLQHTLTTPVHLMIVTSKGDRSSWDGVFYADERRAVKVAATVPGVTALVLPSGGHNFSTYLPTVPTALDWLGHNGDL